MTLTHQTPIATVAIATLGPSKSYSLGTELPATKGGSVLLNSPLTASIGDYCSFYRKQIFRHSSRIGALTFFYVALLPKQSLDFETPDRI
jgi:hypothetical protein